MWGFLVLGAVVLVLATRKGRGVVVQRLPAWAGDVFSDFAANWDGYTPQEQNVLAHNVMMNAIATGNRADMVRIAALLEDMDRPAEALELRSRAAMVS